MSYRSNLLNSVRIKPLVVHSDDRGFLFEVLRRDDEQFEKFGQVYVNYTEPGVIKGLHVHDRNADNFVCISGRVRLALLDHETKEFREVFLGPENLKLVNIPAGLYHGWMCVGGERACVINVSTEPYDRDNPDEHRVPPDYFPWYTWNIVNH